MFCDLSDDDTQTVHEYSYMPSLHFNKLESSYDELFLGIELEISPRDGERDAIAERKALSLLPKFTFAKQDSSIREGFEIVTHPMSISWITQGNMRPLLQILPQLYTLGYGSGGTGLCGVHIHISKIAFTHLQLYKFMYTVYSCPSLGLMLSQRNEDSLAQYASLRDETKSYRQRAKNKSQGGRSRHDAVNISHKGTVELRIFNGTLNPLAFMKNIDVAVCLYNYANDTSLHNIATRTLTKYIRDNAPLYPYLGLFLNVSRENRSALFDEDSGPINIDDALLDKKALGLLTGCMKGGLCA
jgi:hypothetical protein